MPKVGATDYDVGDASPVLTTLSDYFENWTWWMNVGATTLMSGDTVAVSLVFSDASPVPYAPTGLAARGSNGSAELSWGNPRDSTITGYQYRSRGWRCWLRGGRS